MKKKNAKQEKFDFESKKNPPTKHVQVLRGLMTKIFKQNIAESEIVDGNKISFVTEIVLVNAIRTLRYEARPIISQLLDHNFLVTRTPPADQEIVTFYLFPTKKEGTEFRRRQVKPYSHLKKVAKKVA